MDMDVYVAGTVFFKGNQSRWEGRIDCLQYTQIEICMVIELRKKKNLTKLINFSIAHQMMLATYFDFSSKLLVKKYELME